MKIIMDMDEVIVDFITPLLNAYNQIFSSDLTIEDITQWDLPEDLKDIMAEDGFFRRLQPLPGAIEGMKLLKRSGHDVVIATCASGIPWVAGDKVFWVRKWLPEYLDNLCIITRKDCLMGDVMVDDYEENLNMFEGQGICMDRPWNRGYLDCYRVKNWDELIEGIRDIQKMKSFKSVTFRPYIPIPL